MFLGISTEDAVSIKRMTLEVQEAGAAGDTAAHKAINDQIYAYIDKIVRDARNMPYSPDDVVSALLHEIGGGRMAHDDVASVLRIYSCRPEHSVYERAGQHHSPSRSYARRSKTPARGAGVDPQRDRRDFASLDARAVAVANDDESRQFRAQQSPKG